MDDDLLRDFFDELAALRAFLARRPRSPKLDTADPDVLRLIESLAFFTVHTRRTAATNLDAAWRRLLSQDFGYLLAPLPASGLVRAVGASPRFPAARTLPPGAAVQLRTRPSKAAFSTTRELGDLRNVLGDATPLGPGRVAIAFEPGAPRRGAPGVISLFVNPSDDYEPSLDLLEQIRLSVRSVRAIYTTPSGAPVEVGCRLVTGAFAVDESIHPLARLRAFFHDPRQELFLHLVPDAPPGPWTRLTAVAELSPKFDVSRLSGGVLQSHVVPIANQRRAFARPIRFTATRSADPVIPLELDPGSDVLSVLGVYLTRGDDLVPLRCGALGLGARATGAGGGWEPERGSDGRTYLTLRDPESFAAPQTIAVEALWHQPGWASEIQDRGLPIEAGLPDRHLDGVTWQLVGRLVPDDDSALHRRTAVLFDLLGIRSRPALGLDELVILLDWLVPASSVYRSQIERIRSLDSAIAMDLGPRGSGIRRRYTLGFAPGGRDDEALGTVFLGKIRDLLIAWSPDAWVTFDATSGGAPVALPAA